MRLYVLVEGQTEEQFVKQSGSVEEAQPGGQQPSCWPALHARMGWNEHDASQPPPALPYDERTMGHVHSKIKDYKVRDLLPLIQYVRLCMPCVHKFNLQKAVEDLHPKPMFEQIQSMVGVVDGLDPVLTELADKRERQS